jgi:hypothetical protein
MLSPHKEEVPIHKKGPLHPYLPQVYDADTLVAQTLQDPEAVYNAFHELMMENANLCMKIERKSQEHENLEELHNKTISQYEELCKIGSTKQLILWQFIHRLHMASEYSCSATSATSEVLTAIQSVTNSTTEMKGSIDCTRLDPNAVSLRKLQQKALDKR